MNMSANKIYKKILTYDTSVSKEVVYKAYNISKDAHRNQLRGSGEPYFTHPLAVANVLIDMKLDSATIVTALLHDVVEDSAYTLDDIKQNFGIDKFSDSNETTEFHRNNSIDHYAWANFWNI